MFSLIIYGIRSVLIFEQLITVIIIKKREETGNSTAGDNSIKMIAMFFYLAAAFLLRLLYSSLSVESCTSNTFASEVCKDKRKLIELIMENSRLLSRQVEGDVRDAHTSEIMYKGLFSGRRPIRLEDILETNRLSCWYYIESGKTVDALLLLCKFANKLKNNITDGLLKILIEERIFKSYQGKNTLCESWRGSELETANNLSISSILYNEVEGATIKKLMVEITSSFIETLDRIISGLEVDPSWLHPTLTDVLKKKSIINKYLKNTNSELIQLDNMFCFSLFVRHLDNNYKESTKLLKSFWQKLESKKKADASLQTKIMLAHVGDSTVIFASEVDEQNLGKIDYFSTTIHEVFPGVEVPTNVSDMVPACIEDVHLSLMKNFLNGASKAYFNVFKSRAIVFGRRSQKVYKTVVLHQISPNLTSGIKILTLIRKLPVLKKQGTLIINTEIEPFGLDSSLAEMELDVFQIDGVLKECIRLFICKVLFTNFMESHLLPEQFQLKADAASDAERLYRVMNKTFGRGLNYSIPKLGNSLTPQDEHDFEKVPCKVYISLSKLSYPDSKLFELLIDLQINKLDSFDENASKDSFQDVGNNGSVNRMNTKASKTMAEDIARRNVPSGQVTIDQRTFKLPRSTAELGELEDKSFLKNSNLNQVSRPTCPGLSLRNSPFRTPKHTMPILSKQYLPKASSIKASSRKKKKISTAENLNIFAETKEEARKAMLYLLDPEREDRKLNAADNCSVHSVRQKVTGTVVQGLTRRNLALPLAFTSLLAQAIYCVFFFVLVTLIANKYIYTMESIAMPRALYDYSEMAKVSLSQGLISMIRKILMRRGNIPSNVLVNIDPLVTDDWTYNENHLNYFMKEGYTAYEEMFNSRSLSSEWDQEDLPITAPKAPFEYWYSDFSALNATRMIDFKLCTIYGLMALTKFDTVSVSQEFKTKSLYDLIRILLVVWDGKIASETAKAEELFYKELETNLSNFIPIKVILMIILLLLPIFLIGTLYLSKSKLNTIYSVLCKTKVNEIIFRRDSLEVLKERITMGSLKEIVELKEPLLEHPGIKYNEYIMNMQIRKPPVTLANRPTYCYGLFCMTLLLVVVLYAQNISSVISISKIGKAGHRISSGMEDKFTFVQTYFVLNDMMLYSYLALGMLSGNIHLPLTYDFFMEQLTTGHKYVNSQYSKISTIMDAGLTDPERMKLDAIFQPPCDLIDFSQVRIKKSWCQSLGNGAEQKGLFHFLRWFTFEMELMIQGLTTCDASIAYSCLSDKLFNKMQYVFSEVLYHTMNSVYREYTKRAMNEAKESKQNLNLNIWISLILLAIVMLSYNIYFYTHTTVAIKISSNVYLLLPKESLSENSQVKNSLLVLYTRTL